MKTVLIIIGLAMYAVTAYAGKSPTIDDLEQMQKFDEMVDAVEQLESQLDRLTKQRRAKCIRAFGHEEFCSCILKELPVAFDFSNYIAITTKSKEENGYMKLDDEYKKAYDKVRPIRDKCVTELNF